jgi:hypothetical protein
MSGPGSPLTDYHFPRWRQIPFVAALIIILVLSYAPSVTQGTLNVRVFARIPQGVISHLYSRFNYVQLHTAGFPTDQGLVTISQLNPSVDLVPPSGQLIPASIASTGITSGRYDAVRLIFSNSTVVYTSGRTTPISTGPILNANVTIPVPPNGNGEILLVLNLDYSLLLSTNPSISASIAQATSA